MDGHLDLLGLSSALDRVDDGSLRVGHRKPLYLPDFLFRGIVVWEVELDPVAASLTSLRAGESHVNGIGDHIRKLEQLESALVRDHGAGIAER